MSASPLGIWDDGDPIYLAGSIEQIEVRHTKKPSRNGCTEYATCSSSIGSSRRMSWRRSQIPFADDIAISGLTNQPRSDEGNRMFEPYYDDGGGRVIYNGDNCEVMGMMPADSVDLVVTSPPYDNLRTYSAASMVGTVGLRRRGSAVVASHQAGRRCRLGCGRCDD
jgi:hypothetical protein